MLQHLNTTPLAPRRVVVIGAGGFVGSAVVGRLAQEQIPTLAITRKDIDLCEPDAASRLSALLRPEDAVVTASAIAPCKSTAMLVDNMRIVDTFVTALSKSPVAHVVNISSDAIYADQPTPLTETTCTAPVAIHGAMHLAREVAFRSEIRAPLVMLRPTLIYGASDPHNGYGPNRFRRLVDTGKPITLFGEGEERRDHVAIDDVAEIVMRVIENRSAGALNIATGEVHSFRAIAEMVVSYAPHPVPIMGSPRNGPMPHDGYRPFDISACRAVFPDFEYLELAEGLRRAAAA